MVSFSDVRCAVSIAATTSQNHTLVMEADIVDDSEFVIGNGLLECPEEIIGRGHQQGTVVNRIAFISAKRRIGIFLGNTIEPLDKRFDGCGKGPEVKRRSKHNAVCGFDLRNQIIERILLHTRFAVATGIATKTSVYFCFIQRNNFNRVSGFCGSLGERFSKLGGIAISPTSLNNKYVFHLRQPLNELHSTIKLIRIRMSFGDATDQLERTEGVKAEAAVRANDSRAFLLDGFCDFLCIAVTLCAVGIEECRLLPSRKILLHECHHSLLELREVDARCEDDEIVGRKTKATFSGLDRTDRRDYPEKAVREALLNSIVHRDYSFSGSNLVNVYEDRIEFVSLGGLVSGLELKSIFLGVSQSRNPNLAAVFYRMRLIESYGTGIGKIERAYKVCPFQPEFETAKGVFRVTLPNRNEEQEAEVQEIENANNDISLDEQKNLIIQYARENGSVTRKEVEDLIGAGTTKAFRLLKELCEVDKLEQKGSGKLSTYVIK